jgi:hypothetical protein
MRCHYGIIFVQNSEEENGRGAKGWETPGNPDPLPCHRWLLPFGFAIPNFRLKAIEK